MAQTWCTCCDRKIPNWCTILFFLICIVCLISSFFIGRQFVEPLINIGGDNNSLFKSSPTVDTLPGIHYMNKIYNMLSGTNVYSKNGRDIIDYQYYQDEYKTIMTSGHNAYEIAFELSSIPNIIPSCTFLTQTHDIHYSTSTEVLSEQSESFSFGYSQSSPIPYTPATVTNSILYGSSSSSKSAKSHLQSGHTHSLSSDTLATFYKAEIDWNDNDKNFKYKPSFINSIKQFNTNTTNKTILSFFFHWGTHVFSSIQTGAYCKKIKYTSSTISKQKLYDFKSSLNSLEISNSLKTGVVDVEQLESHKISKQQSMENDIENEEEHTFDDVFCNGEVAVTSWCGELTGNTDNPIVTSSELLPIWKIEYINRLIGDESLKKIDLFFKYLNDAFDECSYKHCHSKGVCTLDDYIWSDTFINSVWNGTNFSTLLNVNGDYNNYYCFCDENAFGHDCAFGYWTLDFTISYHQSELHKINNTFPHIVQNYQLMFVHTGDIFVTFDIVYTIQDSHSFYWSELVNGSTVIPEGNDGDHFQLQIAKVTGYDEGFESQHFTVKVYRYSLQSNYN